MGEVSHTHPYSDSGAINRPFQRGPIVAADGGERNSVSRTPQEERSESSGSERDAYDEDTSEEPETEADAREEEADEREGDRMRDVNHTPPHGASANPVFERGGKEEPVESEE
jgi:hypothetical protein